VDEVVVVVPERCRHCDHPLTGTAARRGRVWRHQVVELLPLAVRVTEYQMVMRRCPVCEKRTRAALPAGVWRRPFDARLTAVIALLSGRYRLSRRKVRQLLEALWQVRVSLGAVVRQEQAQSAGPGRNRARRSAASQRGGQYRVAHSADPCDESLLSGACRSISRRSSRSGIARRTLGGK